jgi:two-component system OmpR family response regulator
MLGAMRILLVEDDAMIGSALRVALEDADCVAEWVADAAAASSALSRCAPDAVLLDLGLPDRDGLDLLSSMRGNGSHVPVVILTARDEVDARVRGLDLGADDYVVKPFVVKELLARLHVVVKRRAGHAGALTNGDLWLDPATRQVRRGDVVQQLSAREFSLLHVLLQRPGVICSRPDLERHVYGPGDEVQSNAIEFLIHALRRKLGADAIRNVRGAGWMVERAP